MFCFSNRSVFDSIIMIVLVLFFRSIFYIKRFLLWKKYPRKISIRKHPNPLTASYANLVNMRRVQIQGEFLSDSFSSYEIKSVDLSSRFVLKFNVILIGSEFVKQDGWHWPRAVVNLNLNERKHFLYTWRESSRCFSTFSPFMDRNNHIKKARVCFV